MIYEIIIAYHFDWRQEEWDERRPIIMLLLYPEGKSQEIILGPDLMDGHQVQVVVPGGINNPINSRQGLKTADNLNGMGRMKTGFNR